MMQLTRRPAIIFACLMLFAIAIGGLAIWRAADAPDASMRELNRIAKQGQRLYEQIEDFASIDDPDALLGAIESWEWRSPRELPSEQTEALKSLLAEFLVRRFVSEDAASYRRWRFDSGFRWVENSDEFRQWYDIDILATEWFGEPVSDPFDHTYWFDKFFLRVFEGVGAADHLRAVSVGEDVGVWLIHMLTLEDIEEPLVETDRIPPDMWYGMSGDGATSWIVPERSQTELLEDQGRVLIARAYFIAEARDGSRYPCIVRFHWDPFARRWILTSIGSQNRPWGVGRVTFI